MSIFPKNTTWAVTATTNGFHVYLISHAFPYHTNAAIAFLHKWKRVDEWYKANAPFNAYKVRVSRKFEGENLINPVEIWGDEDNISPIQLQKMQILTMLREHHTYTDEPFQFKCPSTFFFNTFFENILKTDPRSDENVMVMLNKCKQHTEKPAGMSVHRFILQRAASGDFDPWIVKIAQILSMRRPQWLILDTDRYYIAQDIFTCTVYACFQDLLMVDIDEKIDLSSINLPPDSIWAVHATRKGYHLFAVHKRFDHTSPDTHMLLESIGCDRGYIEYVKIRGWSVRLNRKTAEKYPIYTDLRFIGDGEKDDKLVELCTKIMKWSKLDETAISTMP